MGNSARLSERSPRLVGTYFQIRATEAAEASVNRSSENGGLVATDEAASHLGVSPQFLEKDRSTGRLTGSGARIPYVRIGRAIRYRIADLDAFVGSCPR